jgi:hypothetical protein
VDELLPRLELVLDLTAELDQARHALLLHRERRFHRGIEGAAEGDVDGQAGGLEPARLHVGGHVREADALDPAVPYRGDGLEPARRHVDDDAGLPPGGFEPAGLERPCDERDRAVPAGGRVARVMEEDDAEVGALVVGLGDEAAVHVRMSAGFVDEQLAHVIQPLERKAALVEDRGALERRHTAGDDAKRLAGGVVVGCLNLQPGPPRTSGAFLAREASEQRRDSTSGTARCCERSFSLRGMSGEARPGFARLSPADQTF